MKDTKIYNLALLSGPLFSCNMGCNALTYGSLVILSEVAQKLNIQFKYYVFGNPYNGAIPQELDSYNIQLLNRFPDLSIVGLLKVFYHQESVKMTIQQSAELNNVDILFDIGWGDSFTDIYGESRFKSILTHYIYAKKINKPLILLPQTIGPFNSINVQRKAKKILSYSSVIYARDPLSVICSKKLLPDRNVFEATDVAMFMPYQKSVIKKNKSLVIGLNPSGLLWAGGYTNKNQFQLKSNYVELIIKIIEYLISLNEVNIILVGHDISGPNAGNSFDDYYVCKMLKAKYPVCDISPFFYSPIEAKSYISGMDILIGSRMHCCIAAYSSGIPVFPLAYSRKFKGVFEDGINYPYYSDLTIDGINKTMDNIKYFINSYDIIKNEMPDRQNLLDIKKQDLINHLSGSIKKLLSI